jgi:uncharacterized protein YkuJ
MMMLKEEKAQWKRSFNSERLEVVVWKKRFSEHDEAFMLLKITNHATT